MSPERPQCFVLTFPERCRSCFTCVRGCPAKAIRIVDGQAEVEPERCISCGNCIRVCSQGAKIIRNTVVQVTNLLDDTAPVAVLVAPSFPAAFPEIHPKTLVGMIRKLGFDYVHEVAFAADVVARQYKKLLEEHPEKRYIATTCPAIVNFVEKYHPSLTENLTPIVSPMVAMARIVRKIHGSPLKVAFLGPCIAKKNEAIDPDVPAEIDAANTFKGLRRLFRERGIQPDDVEASVFDPPDPYLGGLFPISQGILQAASIDEDLVAGEVVTANGKQEFVDALKEFESGALDARLLEVLACEGCIMGPGMNIDTPLFRRRSQVSQYTRDHAAHHTREESEQNIEAFSHLDLSRRFTPREVHAVAPPEQEVVQALRTLGKDLPEDELNCGACGYETCRDHAVAVLRGFAENTMCLPFTIEKLHLTVHDLGISNEQLAQAQEALVQSEKLASVGHLAAGIAHEINNPLSVVTMYAHMLHEEAEKATPLHADLNMIVEQADRCKKIVAGLLHFSRQNKLNFSKRDVKALFHDSLRSCIIPGTIQITQTVDMENSTVEVDSDQIHQVLCNLITNACAAMPEGGELTLSARDKEDGTHFELQAADTGLGIDKEHASKIFDPFFTTKEVGQGTGLGLAVAYGIIKMHRGHISVQSNNNPKRGATGTTFSVTLPIKGTVVAHNPPKKRNDDIEQTGSYWVASGI
jgi:signal transduction histidine kinase/iron only hydrogenase large subunit-like protein